MDEDERTRALTQLGADATSIEFERGSPGDVTMSGDAFLANAAAVVAAAAPITRLKLTGSLEGRGVELAARPELRGIRRLVLNKSQLTDADLAALAQSPYLGELRDLILVENKIGDAGIEALAASKLLPQLGYVDLTFNPGENPIDRREHDSDSDSHYVPVPRGEELEAKYGRIRWLHPDD